MDTAELQSAMCVLYNRGEHSAVITSRRTEEVEGIVYHIIEFLVTHKSNYSTALPGISTCVWNTFGLSVRTENTLFKPFSIEGAKEACVLVKLPAEGDANWRKITDTPFEGIVLKSSSANSERKFKLTVDDTGTLSVTQVTL